MKYMKQNGVKHNEILQTMMVFLKFCSKIIITKIKGIKNDQFKSQNAIKISKAKVHIQKSRIMS